MANKMLIDATHPEETRVVVLRGNRVEEFDFETAQRKQLRGNIYLAKVTRVEPSLQAAFVEYGGNRHGFLAFSEIHPDYYQIPVADRQALMEDEERAHRDAEDEEEHRGGRRRNGGRHRHRSARRREETIQSDHVEGEDAARPSAAIPAGENTDTGAPSSGEPQPDNATPSVGDEGSDSQPSYHQGSADHAAVDANSDHDHPVEPVGETANPPVTAEIGTEMPAPVPAPAEPVAAETYVATAAQPDAVAEQHAETTTAEDAAPSHDEHAHHHSDHHHDDHDHHDDHHHEHGEEQSSNHSPDAGNGNGNGHDDEEEGVENVGGADAMEEVPDRAPRYRRQYKIQEVIKRRQVMLVQVVKEERGTKGAALTTYLSLAGRYCVLMPNTARGGGISRKITSAEDRRKLREIADALEVPEGMGVILRTAGAARTKAEVKRDFEYLLRMWETVRDLTLKSSAPTLVYEEGSLAKRSIRDLYSKDIEEIVVSGEQGYRDAKSFMRMLMPSHAKNVKLYHDSQPIFTAYGIESQLDAMFSPTVQLRSGGYIVINQTEALVAIDVNSGRSTREHHIEDTALKTNIEAAEEVARQLRLRDLAGLIVVDFIDMDEKRNNRTVERRMKEALRNDRARIQVGRISHFGLLEMSRQRIRTSVLESSTETCPHCGGSGHMRSVSSVALQLLRALEETLLKGATHNQIVHTRPEIALYVLNHKRAHLTELEQRFCIGITIDSDGHINGTTAFAMDRGEQVMTAEQAKEVAARAMASAPKVIEEDEPDVFEDDIEDDGEVFGGTETDGPQEIDEIEDEDEGAEELNAAESEDAEGGERAETEHAARDGTRRRRRRRGRGGRDRDREPRAAQPHSDDSQPSDGDEHVEGSSAASPQPRDGDEQQGEQNGEPRETAETAAEGEQRRRRRGRRGGRRNRRERVEIEGGAANGSGDQPHGDDAGGYHDDNAEETIRAGETPHDESPREFAPAPVSTSEHTPAPVAEHAPVPQSESLTEQPAAAPPIRRRSTVREPAPVFGGTAPAAVAVAAQPEPVTAAATQQPEPIAVTAPVASEEPAKPRRTGWWAKRLLGGDKS